MIRTKRLIITFITLALLTVAMPAFAQNNGEVGAFVDYFRFHNANDLNMLGVGGRIGFNVHPHVALEAEGSYDFERSTNTTFGGLTNPVRTNFRATHVLVGPQFTAGGKGPFRIYGVLKGGFVRFGITPGPVTFGTVPTRLSNTDLNGVFYPGVGVEAFAGILGLRAEVGDEIYFDNGGNNNLKVTVGPVIRF
jgi:hypothetical protein